MAFSSSLSLARRGVSACRPSRAAVRPMCVAKPQMRAATQEPESQTSSNLSMWISATALAAAPLMMAVEPALATGGEYGILEGRTAALVHPAMEFVILGSSLYAGYLGLQWKRTRELGDEIRSLRSSATVAADGTSTPNPALAEKEKERKELLAGNFKDKHFLWGSFLLASGVGMAIAGAANTYMRTGKLFPGPHLYAGAFITALWALAAAQVPAMQKGDNNARTLHISLNVIQIALLAWQVPTGLEIVGKVFEFTSWP